MDKWNRPFDVDPPLEHMLNPTLNAFLSLQRPLEMMRTCVVLLAASKILPYDSEYRKEGWRFLCTRNDAEHAVSSAVRADGCRGSSRLGMMIRNTRHCGSRADLPYVMHRIPAVCRVAFRVEADVLEAT